MPTIVANLIGRKFGFLEVVDSVPKKLRKDKKSSWYCYCHCGLGNFKIYTGLKKNDYYELLADSWVLFNCALQDWWSNTCSEQIALGGITLYPAYRSFPETFANNNAVLYVPWSLDDARSKLQQMFANPANYNLMPLADYADKCIDRTIDIFEGNGEHLSRNTLDYRKHVAVPKYTWS